MKIAIYGGSFNPPHLGHVEAARTVASALAPDRLLIVPASVPPHKELADGSPTAQQRLELCRLAFADIPGAEISEMELRREGKSYSYDTVRLLREENPDAQLILVVLSAGELHACRPCQRRGRSRRAARGGGLSAYDL